MYWLRNQRCRIAVNEDFCHIPGRIRFAKMRHIMSLKMFIAVVLLLLMGVFVIQNMEVVEVDFLLWSIEASRVIIYLTIFLLGAITGYIGKSLRML